MGYKTTRRQMNKLWREQERNRLEEEAKEVPGKLEFYGGKLREVKNPNREGWWRFNAHYDSDGYCDNPSRGY